MFTGSPLKIVEQDRLAVANSTNRGNLVGPYHLPDWASDETWKVSIADKKEMYTNKHKVAVGGPTKGVPNPSEDIPPPEPLAFGIPAINAGRGRGKTDKKELQPFTFHAPPPELIHELIHSYYLKGGINCTGSDGTIEKVFIEKKLPILSLCFSDAHVAGLYAMLDAWVYKKFSDENSPLFQADFVQGLAAEENQNTEKAPRTKATAKPKPKTKAGAYDKTIKHKHTQNIKTVATGGQR